MLLAPMLMYNGKTHYFFMVHRGSIVEQKRLLDGNKLIKKYFLFVFLFSLPFSDLRAKKFEAKKFFVYIKIRGKLAKRAARLNTNESQKLSP